MDVSLCVITHRLHSGWTHKFWVDLPKRAGQPSCCWQTTPVCCATWLINKWSRKQRVSLYVRLKSWPVLMPSWLWAGVPNGLLPALVEGKLIYAILHDSFNTYQKFTLHHDLSTSHSCVGGKYIPSLLLDDRDRDTHSKSPQALKSQALLRKWALWERNLFWCNNSLKMTHAISTAALNGSKNNNTNNNFFAICAQCRPF